MVDGNGTETGHIIVTTIGGRNGQPKQVIVNHFVSVWNEQYTSRQVLIFISMSLNSRFRSLNILISETF